MACAQGYDSGRLDHRSRVLHERWIRKLDCSLLRIEVAMTVDDLCAKVE